MKKLLSLVLLFIFSVVVFTSCEEDDPIVNEHYGRTVVVYMAMQNSLGSGGLHLQDSVELAAAMRYIPGNDRILLFIDDASCPRIYELSNRLVDSRGNGRPELLRRWSRDANSADPATLNEVLTFARDNYPSDSYGLVMGSHANGWLPMENDASYSPRRTFGIDVGPDGSMSSDKGVAGSIPSQMVIPALAQAIRQSGVHLDYLLFDACMMGCIEVAYDLRTVTDYVIASPIAISAEGAYYTDLVRYGLFSSDVRDVSSSYFDYYDGRGSIPCQSSGYGVVLSCIRTAGLDQFATTVRQLLSEICGATAAEKVDYCRRTDCSSALAYQQYRTTYYYRPHYYDLVSAFQALGANADQMSRLRSALYECVVDRHATSTFCVDPSSSMSSNISRPASADDWCGVSMFVPQRIYTQRAPSCPWGDLNLTYQSTNWYNAVY